MDSEKINHSIRAAFVADAYALGAHWIYDGKEIGGLEIDWQDLNAPKAQAGWHKDKLKGDFTHYGDQGKWLYDFVQENGGFDIKRYRDYWLAQMNNYKGYIDASSRETVAAIGQNPDSVVGSASTELSIIGRIAPLLLVSSTREEFLDNVQCFVALTHNSPRVLSAAALFASILLDVIEGKSINEALDDAVIDPMLQGAFDAGLKSKNQDSFRTIRQFGPACGIEGGFEGVIHLLSTYDDFKDAIMANVKSGGDSAARGMVVGMIMGAADKMLPDAWVTGMNGF